MKTNLMAGAARAFSLACLGAAFLPGATMPAYAVSDGQGHEYLEGVIYANDQVLLDAAGNLSVNRIFSAAPSTMSTLAITGSNFSVGGSTLVVSSGIVGVGLLTPSTQTVLHSFKTMPPIMVNGEEDFGAGLIADALSTYSSDNVDTIAGGRFSARAYSDVNVGNLVGLAAQVERSGSTVATGPGVVQAAVGLYVGKPDNPSAYGTINDTYGIYIDTQTSGNQTRVYTLYSEDPAATAYFKGPMSASLYEINGSTMLRLVPGAAWPSLAVGPRAGFSSTGSSNTFVGYDAGLENVTGSSNTFVGAGAKNVGGNGNAYFGYMAGANLPNPSGNSFFGAMAGADSISGEANVFVGVNAGLVNAGSANTFLGYISGQNNDDGGNNTFVGYGAGYKNIELSDI